MRRDKSLNDSDDDFIRRLYDLKFLMTLQKKKLQIRNAEADIAWLWTVGDRRHLSDSFRETSIEHQHDRGNRRASSSAF